MLEVLQRKNKLSKTEIGIKVESLRALGAILESVDINNNLGTETQIMLIKGIKEGTFHKIPKVRSSAKLLLNNLYTRNQQSKELIDEILDGKMVYNKSKSLIHYDDDDEEGQDRLFDHLDDNTSVNMNESQLKGFRGPSPIISRQKLFNTNTATDHHNSSHNFQIDGDDDRSVVSSQMDRSFVEKMRFKKAMQKTGRMKMSRTNLDDDKGSCSPAHKRGLHIISDPLNEMTKGKGWGANVRGKSYLKRGTGLNPNLEKEKRMIENRRRMEMGLPTLSEEEEMLQQQAIEAGGVLGPNGIVFGIENADGTSYIPPQFDVDDPEAVAAMLDKIPDINTDTEGAIKALEQLGGIKVTNAKQLVKDLQAIAEVAEIEEINLEADIQVDMSVDDSEPILDKDPIKAAAQLEELGVFEDMTPEEKEQIMEDIRKGGESAVKRIEELKKVALVKKLEQQGAMEGMTEEEKKKFIEEVRNGDPEKVAQKIEELKNNVLVKKLEKQGAFKNMTPEEKQAIIEDIKSGGEMAKKKIEELKNNVILKKLEEQGGLEGLTEQEKREVIEQIKLGGEAASKKIEELKNNVMVKRLEEAGAFDDLPEEEKLRMIQEIREKGADAVETIQNLKDKVKEKEVEKRLQNIEGFENLTEEEKRELIKDIAKNGSAAVKSLQKLKKMAINNNSVKKPPPQMNPSLNESQARMLKNKERNKERRTAFKSMIADSKRNTSMSRSKGSKFSMIDRKAERIRKRRLNKIKQGIDPDIPTPDEFMSDPNSSEDSGSANHSPSKIPKNVLGGVNSKHKKGVNGQGTLGELLDELENTMKCPDDEAEDIAMDNLIQRYLRMQENHSSLKMETLHIWRLVLRLIEAEDFSKAFELLFRLGDDLYFLRGCLLCGPKVIARVHKRTATKMLRKLSEIRLGNKLIANHLVFIEKGIKSNFLDIVDVETTNSTLEALKRIQSNFDHSLKSRAEYLYQLVIEINRYN